MLPLREFHRYVLISLAAVMLAACAGQKEPAQKLLGDIEAAVNAASADAAKYVPDQLNDVQTKLDDLKAAFNRQDYKAVVTGAPPLLSEAQGLASAAAAKKADVMKGLNDAWSSLSGAVPGYENAIQSRIDLLSQKKNRKMAAGIDLAAAKSSLSDATSLWSKAQGAFGNGNMDEAVATAKDVKAKLDSLASSLKMPPLASTATPAIPATPAATAAT
jgi:hypothetical protein